ncbi:MAG: hypothetical protein JRI93_06370 [Deltaproteobacteria bacterium]|nr:hypothetical protein [Deltaproteobacteria bacterium]
MTSFAFESQANSRYHFFSDRAEKDSFYQIAAIFEETAEQEREHAFLALAENIHSGRTFKREERMLWRCRNCGYMHAGSEAPSKCPACVRPSGHFELFCENW